MPENIEGKLAQAQDVSATEKESRGPGLELAKSEEKGGVIEVVSEISQALEKDDPVTQEKVDKLEEALQNVKVDFGGEGIPIVEIKDDPEMMNNIRIWNMIKSGSLDGIGVFMMARDLTRITPGILKIIVSHSAAWDSLSLREVSIFSDDCAKELRGYNGFIDLRLVTNLSDEAMDDLAHNTNNAINLKAITSLSDRQALALSKLKGSVYLDNLESISETGIRHLARNDRDKIVLSGEMDEKVERYRSTWSKLKKRLSKTKK